MKRMKLTGKLVVNAVLNVVIFRCILTFIITERRCVCPSVALVGWIRVFGCAHASLKESLSIGRSVRPYVRSSVEMLK